MAISNKTDSGMFCGAVIVAAGTASRMGGIDKVMAELKGEPMIVRTVRAFQSCEAIGEIVVVTRADLTETIRGLCADFPKVKAVVVGGADRPESVRNGLNALSEQVKLVAVQDGARPLITDEVIERTVRAAQAYSAAAPGVFVKDTVKIIKDDTVQGTPDRNTLRAIQTPQVFDLSLLQRALLKAKEENASITDDCSAVERLGIPVRIVEGDEKNIKITTPMDLKIASLLLEETE